MIRITTPLTKETIRNLHAGDSVLLSGTVYTARDAAHKRLCEAMGKGESLPFDINSAVIYFAGPCPAKPGETIGSCGPTSACRMDSYSPALYRKGLAASIGKGIISDEVRRSLEDNTCVFLVATGGAGALIKQCIKKAEIIAYSDLGPEAIYKLEVEDMPLIVGNDCYGMSAYK